MRGGGSRMGQMKRSRTRDARDSDLAPEWPGPSNALTGPWGAGAGDQGTGGWALAVESRHGGRVYLRQS